MILLQAMMAAPMMAVFILFVLIGLSSIVILIYNHLVMVITKNKSRQLPVLQSAIIIAILVFCYFVYRLFTYEGTWIN